MVFILQKNSLKEPTTHWREKSEKHNRRFKWMIGTTIAVSLVTIFLLGFLAYFYLNNNLYNLEINRVTIFLLISGLSVWGIKFMANIALHHRHRSEQAYDKEIKVKTYLSLLSNQEVKEKDLSLVLQSLFHQDEFSKISESSIIHNSIFEFLRNKFLK